MHLFLLLFWLWAVDSLSNEYCCFFYLREPKQIPTGDLHLCEFKEKGSNSTSFPNLLFSKKGIKNKERSGTTLADL